MLRSVEGVYCEGKVHLSEPVPSGTAGRVIVTFLDADSARLSDRGIDEPQAADLRQRLRTFAEDWDRPEMDVYDDL